MSETPVQSDEALALPQEITFQGRTLRFAPWDNLEVVAYYERYLKQQVRASLRQDMADMDFAEAQQEAERVSRDLHSGVYKFGSKAYFNSLNAFENLKQLAWLEARHFDKELPRDVIEAMWADEKVRGELLSKILPQGEAQKKSPFRDAA